MSQFSVNDIVYIKSSAARGFLESYRISAIYNDGFQWVYRFEVAKRTPHVASVGWTNTLTHDSVFELAAEELCDFCDAVLLAEQYFTSKLAEIQALKTRCP